MIGALKGVGQFILAVVMAAVSLVTMTVMVLTWAAVTLLPVAVIALLIIWGLTSLGVIG